MASGKGISRESVSATTNRTVIDDLTFGINTAGSGARINAFLIGARFVQITIWADGTFGPARWRCANETLQTRTYGLIVVFSTSTIRTAWWRLARILMSHNNCSTLNECIARHSHRTAAYWNMVVNMANGLLPTESRTWIPAFVLDAR